MLEQVVMVLLQLLADLELQDPIQLVGVVVEEGPERT
jgi:hypothetical protein